MKLSTEDAELFVVLMSSLQHYINQKLNILPSVKSFEEYIDLSLEVKAEIRNGIYDNPHLIQQFIEENPHKFDKEKLVIIEKWKHFVKGKFYIERYLKKNAIFIGNGNKTYAVLALTNSFDDFYPKSQLPILIETVLLPFKNLIVYDGWMATYNISFGSGITSDLKEIYLSAKQNGNIIYSLDSENPKKISSGVRTGVLEPKLVDWKPEVEKLLVLAKKLRGGNGQPLINGPTFSLVKASLKLANDALDSPKDVDVLYKSLEKVESALRKAENAIYRMD